MQPNAEALPNYVKTIPLPLTRKLLETGRKRFDITCGTCHGPLGDGESIVARQMSLRPPPSLFKYIDRPSGYFYEVITKGFGMMASYAAELTVEERWAIVAYIRALQLSQTTPAAELPPEARREIEALPPGVNEIPVKPEPEADEHEGHGEHQQHEEKR
jgi:mono/diheme cytochrome c family protein